MIDLLTKYHSGDALVAMKSEGSHTTLQPPLTRLRANLTNFRGASDT